MKKTKCIYRFNAVLRIAGIILTMWSANSSSQEEAWSYQEPPAKIIQMVDAPRVPAMQGSASPQGRWVLVDEFGPAPPSRALAVPTLILAPWRVDPVKNSELGVLTFGLFKHIAVYDSVSGRRREFQPRLVDAGDPLWSPSGDRFAFLRAGESGVQLWIGDPSRGEIHQVPGVLLNAARVLPKVHVRLPCEWFADSRRLLCLAVPAGRGPPPRSQGQMAPVVRDTQSADSGLTYRPKYETFLRNLGDEALYDYYMTAQPIVIDTLNNEGTKVGSPGIYKTLLPSPNGRYLLSIRIQKPYSYETYDYQFPSVTEVLDSTGRLVKLVASTPLDVSGRILSGNAPVGPRQFFWQPTAPSTLAYYEALDKGRADRTAPYRDSLRLMAAPFSASVEVFRSKARMGYWPVRSLWGSKGLLILEELDWGTQQRRAWKLDTRALNVAPQLLWSYKWKDNGDLDSPGELVTALGSTTGREWSFEASLYDSLLLQEGNWVYLRGSAKTPSGAQPFLDRFNLNTHQKRRVFQSPANAYQEVISVLDSQARRLLIASESPLAPPNLTLVDQNAQASVALTHYTDPFPELTSAQQRTIRYARADGLSLIGRLYLPASYRPGETLPVIMYGYPMLAGSNHVKPLAKNRFRGIPLDVESPLPLITQGYAVFQADMLLDGGKMANDTNNEQLAADATAAVDTLVNMGIADPAKIGIVGHSYGGFMVANLLENTKLFSAGVAISGIYNLTVTPTYSQYDGGRSYWQAPEVWDRMSPLQHADKITAPLLLLHGEKDGSSGATARQSMGMFEAMESLGKPSRLVIFPNEDHLFRGREAMLHAQWEMLTWFDRYLRNQPPTQRPSK